GQNHGHETGVLVFRPGGALKVEPRDFSFFKTLQPFNTRIDEWAPRIVGQILNFQPQAVVFMGKVAHLYGPTIANYLPSITRVATYRSGKPPVAYYRRAMLEAHGVITNSHAEHKRLISPWGIPEKLIHTVLNGCIIHNEGPVLTERSTGPLKLLCVAMFRPQKNQIELLEILSSLPPGIDWRCTFAGTGKTLKTCKAKVRELKVQDRVDFTWSDNPVELYNSHDILVHSSTKESLPNSLIEAQCCGLPVVAYLVNGVRECFEEGVSGFGIPVGSRHAFRDAIHLLAMEPKRLRSMSEAAHEFGRKHFNFGERAREFFEVIESIQRTREQQEAR
ncbi:MAG: glycosyltransferase, partial [Verrucomicrobiae bacterium]|nr:glycosyltransferase [Verrucomicrobiae bacterium]